jgi:putative ABC transport system permease protein
VSIIDTFLTAITALYSNKLRSFLTMLGIVIGVGAVIALMSVGQGAQQDITGRIQGLGTNLLFVRGAEAEVTNQVQAAITDRVLTLVDTDAEAINDPERFPYVEGVSARSIMFTGTLTFTGTSISTSLTGVTPDYSYVREFYVSEGRFINEDDIDSKALVAVLGSRAKERLFGDTDPLGKIMRLSVGPGSFGLNFIFRVVGVMEPKGATSTGDEDDLVLLPLPTMQARIPFLRNPQGLSNIDQITVRVDDKKHAGETKEEIRHLLSERHGQEDFIIRTQEDLVSTVTEVSRTLTILLGSIAGISLLVGGIGIMNIMLVSVTERTREIGIRKAVGARRRDILMQFLVEALTVTLVGGTIGILAGVAVAEVADGRSLGGQDVSTLVTPWSIMVAFGVSGAIGVFFGLYPAYNAARLDPIEALRHE